VQQSDPTLARDFFDEEWKTTTSKAGAAPPDFVPLPVQNLVPGREVPFEVLVRTRAEGREGDQFKTCCLPGEKFEPGWLDKFQDAGISRVYFRHQDQPRVFAYLNQHLPVILIDDNLPVREKAERVADITYFWVNQLFTNTQGLVAQHLEQGFEYVDHLLRFIRQDHYQRHWLLDLYRYDQNLYSHSLNTSLLAMAFANYLGWEERKIGEMGRGALLHDLGMIRVPPAILGKRGSLSEEEWEVVKKHPYHGFVLLKTLSPISREALLVVLQHHENGDGSGYPEGLKMGRIHPLARMMRLIDSFEALVSPRNWRPGNPPSQALWIMRQEWQTSGIFDAGLLAEFIKFIAGQEQQEKENRG
jgi:HD-GYP domain-containing protein (c-di-GMP phosphodiesterase class II)